MTVRWSLKFVRVAACRRSVFSRILLILSIVLAVVALVGRGGVLAQTAPREDSAIVVHVPDAELIDQDGQRVHLYSDLVKGRKVVVINTMFTTCGTICPLIGVRMSRLQQSLGACRDHDYDLVSITVDPTADTPERLREWGRKFGIGPCWRLLTGPKADVDAALRTLHLLTPDKLSHTPSALIGRDGADDWTLCNVLASQENLVRIVRKKMSAAVAQRQTR